MPSAKCVGAAIHRGPRGALRPMVPVFMFASDAVGTPRASTGLTADLVIDRNDPGMHGACTQHLPGLIEVAVTQVSPGPARLRAYKSGFLWHDGRLLYTPLGTMSVAPVASTTLDPGNAGICYP